MIDGASAVWPRVGRDVELEALEQAIGGEGDGGPGRGRHAVVVGDVGVGKSRLVADLLDGLAQRGLRTVLVRATRSTATIPFGPFVAWTSDRVDPDPTDRLHVLRTIATALLQGDQRVVVAVDDAHLLDEGSAALVLHLAVHTPASVVVTVRSDVPCPDAIMALWKEGLADLVDLAPLSEADTTELLRRVLGDGVPTATARRLRTLTRGAPLYLREVVRAAVQQGVLARVDGMWRWEGELAGGRLPGDLTSQRLGQLGADARRSLELVALGEPLPLAIAARAAGSLEALADVERQGLVVIEDGGDGDPLVRLAHPLYGEVLRADMPKLAARDHQAALAGAAAALGWQERDPLRVALWWLASGSADGSADGPTDVLVAGSRRALGLAEWRLAERLARSAEDSGAGAEATLTRAAALVHLHGWGEVSGALAGIAPDALDGDALAQHTRLRAGHEAWVEGRLSGGRRALTEVAARLPSPSRSRSLAEAAFLALAACDLPQAGRLATGALEHAGPSAELRARALAVAALAHAVEGRGPLALEVAETGASLVPAAIAADPLPDNPAAIMGVAHGLALALDGRLDDASALVESFLAHVDEHHIEARRTFTASAAARLALLQGRLVHAERRGREALADAGPGPSSQLPAAIVATANAQLGAIAPAEEALDLATRSTPVVPIYGYEVALAGAWVAAARGELSAARTIAAETADRAAADGVWFFEVLALLDLTRLGEPERSAPRLTALSAVVEGPFAATAAAYARTLAAGEGAGLDDASAGFETMGALLLAAEAATGAALAHRASGRSVRHRAAVARAHRLAGRCDGARTVALRHLDAEPAAIALTRREREVADLAARGASDAEIAARLVVSVRTVETHLHRTYRKLGVSKRRHLPAALGI